jgi:hypothetical protein
VSTQKASDCKVVWILDFQIKGAQPTNKQQKYIIVIDLLANVGEHRRKGTKSKMGIRTSFREELENL